MNKTDLISRSALLRMMSHWKPYMDMGLVRQAVKKAPAVDAVPVVRCKDCIHYHKAYVLCNDGTEKDYSEFPPEAFGTLGYGVTAEYGINVGGKCELEKNVGYSVDKSVFRKLNDFCSYGERKGNETD